MKPVYSDEDRRNAVRNFIAARYQGLAKISDFSIIALYLEEERVELLCTVEPSGRRREGDSYSSPIIKYYTADDAEFYFDWLTHVVTGAESASEDTIKKANDQLFIFILALRDYTEMDAHVKLVEPYSWERNFALMAKSLTDFQAKMEKRDEMITDALTRIQEWVKTYQTFLEEMKRDYDVHMGKLAK